VASIALMHTGMERERAKFQARSAFTGTGFTTSESEMVVKHPMRRKIIMTLLLLGNAGFVTAISSLIIGFTGDPSPQNQARHLTLLLAGLLLLFLITRSKRLERILDRFIIHLIQKYTDLRPQSFERLITIMDDFEVMELSVKEQDGLCGKSLAELKLPDQGLLVLGVIEANDHYNGVPRGDYRINADDRLILYGQAEKIANLSLFQAAIVSTEQR
jgi:hypothetical protein